MTKILGISGSLRKDSWNTKVLHALAPLVPEGCTIEVATLHGIPLYDGDLESAQGIPQSALDLREKIAAADGLLLASPEYNGGLPGVLKNAIDWMSRGGDAARAFRGRPTALCGATPGRGGTRFAQAAWLPVFRVLGVDFWSAGQLYLGSVHQSFDEAGQWDESTLPHSRAFITDFVDFIKRTRR